MRGDAWGCLEPFWASDAAQACSPHCSSVLLFFRGHMRGLRRLAPAEADWTMTGLRTFTPAPASASALTFPPFPFHLSHQSAHMHDPASHISYSSHRSHRKTHDARRTTHDERRSYCSTTRCTCNSNTNHLSDVALPSHSQSLDHPSCAPVNSAAKSASIPLAFPFPIQLRSLCQSMRQRIEAFPAFGHHALSRLPVSRKTALRG